MTKSIRTRLILTKQAIENIKKRQETCGIINHIEIVISVCVFFFVFFFNVLGMQFFSK